MFSTRQFTVDPKTLTFCAEITDLPNKGSGLFGQVYDDACDQGFTMVSGRTGQQTRWYLGDTVRDLDGDLMSWTFYPDQRDVRKFPAMNGWKVVVFND
jgi:hypothetical protein